MVSSAILNNHGNLSIAASSGTVSAPNGATNFFIAAAKTDIANYAIEGSDLVIEFMGGQKLTIKNFFAGGDTIHNLVLNDGATLLWVDFFRAFDAQTDGIDDPKVIYSEIKDRGDAGATGALLTILGGVAGLGAAISSANSGSDDMPPSSPPPPSTNPRIIPTPDSPGAEDKQGEIQGFINDGDETDADRPEFSGKADEPGSTIIIYDNGVEIGRVDSDSVDGTWIWTPPIGEELGEGAHAITVVEEASDGAQSDPSDPLEFVVDTTPPSAFSTITAITDDTGISNSDFITSDQSLLISGTLSELLGAGEYVQIRINGGDWLDATVTGNGLTWEYDHTATSLDEGSYQIETRTVDTAGNESLKSPPLEFVVDVTPPPMATIVMISADTGEYYDFITSDQTLAFYGTVDQPLAPDERVQIRVDGGLWLDATYDANGVRVEDGVTMSWVYDHTNIVLGDGLHTLDVRVVDAAGNITNGLTRDIEIETSSPQATAQITAITDDSGVVGDFITNDQTLIISGNVTGTITDNERVQIRIDGGNWQDVEYDNQAGTWEYDNQANPLSEGPHVIDVQIVNKAGTGNYLPGNSRVINIDITGPQTAVAITGYNDDIGTVRGNITANPSATDDARPRLYGTATAENADDYVVIMMREVGQTTWSELGITAIVNNGWDYQVTTDLDNKTYEFMAVIHDKTGNAGSTSVPWTIEIDTLAPGALNETLIQLWDDFGAQQGLIDPGGRTDDWTPEYRGLPGSVPADSGIVWVHIYNTDPQTGAKQEVGIVNVNPDGSWSFTPNPPLGLGSFQFSARGADAAGNLGPETDLWDFTVFAERIGTPAITDIVDDKPLILGKIEKGAVTDDDTPTVHGTGTPNNELHILVKNPGSSDFVEDGTVIIAADGTWAYTLNPLTDGNGTYAVQVYSVNPTGGTSTPTTPYEFVLDMAAPDKPDMPVLTDNVGNDTGIINAGDTTDDNKPFMTGNVPITEAGGTVTIYIDGQPVGTSLVDNNGSWRFQPMIALDDAPHTVTINLRDKAGNLSDFSDEFSFTVDTSGAPVTVSFDSFSVHNNQDMIFSGDLTNDKEPTLLGTATALAQVTVTYLDEQGNVVTLGTTFADSDGDWMMDAPPLGDQVYNFTASASLNGDTQTVHFTLEVDATPPAAPVITRVQDDVGIYQDDLPIPSGGITDDTTPTFYGTAEVDSWITIRREDGTIVGEARSDANGNWVITTSQLPEDLHNFTITATDRAGNESGPAEYTLLTVMTTPPEQKAEITAIEDDTGASNSDFITSSQHLIFKGVVDKELNVAAGDKLQFRIDGGDWIDVTNYDLATNSWELDYTHVTLSAGQHVAVISVIDAAGNRTFANDVRIVTIDLSAPDGEGNIIDFVDDVGNSTGVFSTGSFTDDTMPLLRGNLTNVDPGDRVMIYMLDDQNGRILLGEATRQNGSFEYQIGSGQELAQGHHRFIAVIEDVAGNESAASDPFTINVDLTVPVNTATLTAILDDTGISDSDFITADPSLTYVFTPDQSLNEGETVWMRITPAGGGAGLWRQAIFDASDGLWKLSPAEILANGDYEIESQVRNQAGTGGLAKSQKITIDTIIGNNNITITDYLDNDGAERGSFGNNTVTDDRAPVLRGIITSPLASDEMVVIYKDGVRLDGKADVMFEDGQWRWSYQLPDLADESSNIFVARVEDVAGNQIQTPSGQFIINVSLEVNINSQNTIDTTPIISGSTGFDIRPGEYVTVTVNNRTYSSQTGEVVVDLRNNTWYVQIPDNHIIPASTQPYEVVANLYSADGQLITSDKTTAELTVSQKPTTIVGQGGADPHEKATAVTMDENGSWMIFTNQAIMQSNATGNFDLGSFAVTQVQSQKGGSFGNNYVHSGTWMDYNRDGYMDFFGADSSFSNGQQAFLNNGDGTWRAYHVGLSNIDGGAKGGTGNGADEKQEDYNPDGNPYVWYGGIVAFDKAGTGLTSLVYGDQSPPDPYIPGDTTSSAIVINTDGEISGFKKDHNFQAISGVKQPSTNWAQMMPDIELSGVDLDNNGTIDLVFHSTTGSNHIGKGSASGKPRSSEQRRLVVASNEGNGDWNVTQIVENVFQRDYDDKPNRGNGVAMSWADFNGDGYMDLFIGRTVGDSLNNQYRSRIHFNDGNGKIAMSDPNNDGIGEANNSYTFNDDIAGGVSLAIDWNHDGLMDVIELPTLSGGDAVPSSKHVGPINLYTNQGGGNAWNTTNMLGGNNTIGNNRTDVLAEWVTGAVAIDVDWDGARDLLVFTRQGNTRYIHNDNEVEFGTSLHFKIVDAEGINAFYGNTVILYNSAGERVSTQMINPQSGNQTNDSTAIVDFYGLNPNDTYTLVMLHHQNGDAFHYGGVSNIDGRVIQNVNAGWTGLKAGEANHAYVLTAEDGNNAANANKGNGIVGTGYNDTFIATRGEDAYFGSGGTVTVSGVKSWMNAGGVNIVDYKLAGDQSLTIDLSITTYQNTGFNNAKFVGIQGISGGNGNDTFTDNGEDNVFNGGRGDDSYNLIHGGRDTIIYGLLDNDGVGGNGLDTINGFTIGTYEATPNADRIDLKALLVGYVADGDGPAQYLDLRVNGGNSELWIDRDGAGGQYGWSHLVTLNNINDTSLGELLANHQIIAG